MEKQIFDYCLNRYTETYQQVKQDLESQAIETSRNHSLTVSKIGEIEKSYLKANYDLVTGRRK